MLDYRISDAAQRDIDNLTGYTAERFGELALDRYLRLLDVTITKLRNDPERPGIRNFSPRCGSVTSRCGRKMPECHTVW